MLSRSACRLTRTGSSFRKCPLDCHLRHWPPFTYWQCTNLPVQFQGEVRFAKTLNKPAIAGRDPLDHTLGDSRYLLKLLVCSLLSSFRNPGTAIGPRRPVRFATPSPCPQRSWQCRVVPRTAIGADLPKPNDGRSGARCIHTVTAASCPRGSARFDDELKQVTQRWEVRGTAFSIIAPAGPVTSVRNLPKQEQVRGTAFRRC
jgi:hypothetical protein